MHGLSDLVAMSLARVLVVNSSLEEVIINKNITDNGIVHIAKSLQKNNTLKILHVEQHSTESDPSFTDTGVLLLARGVATNTSMECLWMRWHSTDPESTLRIMAESIKNSNLKKISLYINSIWILGAAPVKTSSLKRLSLYLNRIWTQGEAPAMSVHTQEAVTLSQEREWYHGVEVGVKELIMSLEDSHLELFELIPLLSSCRSQYHDEHPLQLQTAIDSVNLARHKKGLHSIHFKIPGLT